MSLYVVRHHPVRAPPTRSVPDCPARLLLYTTDMSLQEAREVDRQLQGLVVEAVDPAAIERGQITAPPGSGKTEMFLRVLLTTNFDALIDEAAGSSRWAEAVRNAIVHEVQLSQLVARAAPGLAVDGLIRLLNDAFAVVEVKSALPEAHFSDAELAELGRDGLLTTPSPTAPGAAGRTAAEFTAMITHSLSVPEAADLLGVDESRIRQRLTDRTLYGFKVGRTWRLPRFQFTDHSQVPGLDQVLPHLPSGLHPIAVQRWLTEPSPDLELDQEVVSPIEWLAATGDVTKVVDIARDV